MVKEAASKNEIIGSQVKRNHNVFTHHSKDNNREVCIMTMIARARCKIRTVHRVYGIEASTNFGDLITADRPILNVRNRVTVSTQQCFKRAG